jgi:glycosyltransferase involved in cell wall biosynthesis
VNDAKPLVSVTIPTRNSGDTLDDCIRKVREQDYPNIEIIVIDTNSRDRTGEIARVHGARVISTDWRLLGARYLGVKEAQGEFVLFLDSDQFLEKDCISRAVARCTQEKYDMLCLGERAYSNNTFVEKLFDADRRLVNNLSQIHLDPDAGVLLPRFFRRSLLSSAFEKIDHCLYPIVVAHDHAIIYYEASKLSRSIGILENAVAHKEPSGLAELWRKNYNYGKTTRALTRTGLYSDLIRKKTRIRKGTMSNFSLGFQSTLLLLLKAVPYELGYFL